MVITKIGINFSAIESVPPPTFNFTNQTIGQFVDSIPANANSVTDGYFGIIILLTLVIALAWLLTEKSQYSRFGYSKMRGLTIALGVALIMGANMLQMGYMNNFVHFVYLNSVYIILLIWTMISNPT